MSVKLPSVLNALVETGLDPKDHKLKLSHTKGCHAMDNEILDFCDCSPNAVVVDRFGNTVCYIHAVGDELVAELKKSTWN